MTFYRKAHVKRFKSEDDPDFWVDIMRLDEILVSENAGGQTQYLKLKWLDDDSDTANEARETETVRIPHPADESKYIEVKAIKSMVAYNSDQRMVWHFDNSRDNEARKVSPKKVYSTSIDLDMTAPVDWNTYQDALAAGSQDTSTAINFDITDNLFTTQQQGFDFQADTRWIWTKDLKDMPIFGTSDDTPVRLDPFQTIVNVKGTPSGSATYYAMVQYEIFDDSPDGTTMRLYPHLPNVSTGGPSARLYRYIAGFGLDYLSADIGMTPSGLPSDQFVTPPTGYAVDFLSVDNTGYVLTAKLRQRNLSPPFDTAPLSDVPFEFGGSSITLDTGSPNWPLISSISGASGSLSPAFSVRDGSGPYYSVDVFYLIGTLS